MSHYGHLPLRDAYFSPERVSREGGIEPLFRGAVRQAAQEVDLKVGLVMNNHIDSPLSLPSSGRNTPLSLSISLYIPETWPFADL